MLSISSQMTIIDDAVQLTASEDSGGSTFAMMGLHGFWGRIETIAPCLHEACGPGAHCQSARSEFFAPQP